MAVEFDRWPFPVREAAHAYMSNEGVTDGIKTALFALEPFPKVESIGPRLRSALQPAVRRSALKHGARKVHLDLWVHQREEGIAIATIKRVAIRSPRLLRPRIHPAKSRCQ
jgi:hypothetical protein